MVEAFKLIRPLDDEHIESFGSGIYGNRQSGRTRPDDDDVAQLRPVYGVVEAEAVGDLTVTRIAEHDLASADQYRDVRDRHLESIE